MSKKNKKSAVKLDDSTLQKQAEHFLEAQRYKEAIEAYKKLLKQESRQIWQEKLAVAYLGRANALAAKGMYKEAIVFWENRDKLCEDKAQLSDYIEWLVLAGRQLKALRLFVKHPLDEAQNQRLSVLFATLLLVGDAELITELPAESALYQHYEIVKSALLAYYQGHDDTVRACLKKIPFRSPYRDMMNILKALITLETDPQDALKLIQQIPPHSPMKGFAELVNIYLLPPEVLIERMTHLTAAEQAFVAFLKGWGKNQIRIMASLQSVIKRECSTRALFDVVITNSTFFGTDYSQRFCLASLPDYIEGIPRYGKAFGHLSVFEKARLTALNHERRGRMMESDHEWQKCLDILKRQAHQEDNTLKAALILRHLAEAWIIHSNEMQTALEYLTESLRLDPDDKASYHRVLELINKKEDLTPHQSWIRAGVERFPRDRELLLAAITVERREENFAEALQYASTLVKADPTSTKAKQILLHSYLDYSRELVRNAKYKQADKLFKGIEQHYPSQGVVAINQGLLALQKGEKREAKYLLIQGVEQSGNDICGQFRLMAEVALMQIEWKTISPLVPLPTRRHTYAPTQEEIITLTKVVSEYYEEYPYIFTEELIKPLQSPLKKAGHLLFTMVERANICQFLKEMKNYKLLRQYAKMGITHYPDYHPAFTYFQIYAEIEGDAEQLSPNDMYLLEKAIGIAEKQGDKLASVMIIDLFHQGLHRYIHDRLSPEIQQALSELREHYIPEEDDDDLIDFIPPPLRDKK
ncbi:MAG: hypothetical protein BWK79_04080 [Beggiatoa sp. IS2]|nr:MAG: hypothetical protein BWK79_04080 [Beggiatoa sp. IS2]